MTGQFRTKGKGSNRKVYPVSQGRAYRREYNTSSDIDEGDLIQYVQPNGEVSKGTVVSHDNKYVVVKDYYSGKKSKIPTNQLSVNTWEVKEKDYRNSKQPYALYLNGKFFRGYDTEEQAEKWGKYYKKYAKYHKP